MNNLRLSVTDLDQFVYWRKSEQDVEELMRRLRKEEPPTPAMATGRALHCALENATDGTFIALEAEGYSFNVLGSVELALPAIRELKAEKPIQVSQHLTVTLVGKVDAVDGRVVHDHKTNSRFEAEYLFETYQWRNYLDMFNADVFQWNCFTLKQVGLTEYDVTDFNQVRQYRYPNMEQDCRQLLDDFLTFLGIERMRFPMRTPSATQTTECTLANLLRANQ